MKNSKKQMRSLKSMKNFVNEFKLFIKKGNVLDMAIGVIIGGAFGKIVSSLVNDIIMPLVSLAVGGASVSDWKWVIKPAKYSADGVLISAETAFMYGSFIQTIIDFLIISLVVFLFMKTVLAAKTAAEDVKNTVENKLIEDNIITVESDKTAEPVKTAETVIEPAPAKPNTEELLTEIRDLIKNNTTKQV